MLPPADESCKSRAEARRKPEKPELADICAAGEQRARDASGQAAAAPPSVAKNFRRSMWLAM